MSSMELSVQAIKTKIFRHGSELGLTEFLASHLESVSLERKVLVVTSKIVSLAEGQLVPQKSIEKGQLIKNEAEYYLGEVGHGCHLTIKHGILGLTAGIDVSNSTGGNFILLPKDPFKSAKDIYFNLKRKLDLKEFGVLISDSRTLPLRKGVLGCGLACFGFKPIQNEIGKEDLFNQKLKMTQINCMDALASAAVLVMGEANEQTPLALISGGPVAFGESFDVTDFRLEMSEDLYFPMYRDLIKHNQIKN